MLDRFLWLADMTFGDLAPAYIPAATFIVVALTRGLATGFQSMLAVAASHLGPVSMLLWGAAMYGASTGAFSWVEWVHIGLAIAGIVVVAFAVTPLRRRVPTWSLVFFFVGVAIINFIAMFVSGMALVDDWV